MSPSLSPFCRFWRIILLLQKQLRHWLFIILMQQIVFLVLILIIIKNIFWSVWTDRVWVIFPCLASQIFNRNSHTHSEWTFKRLLNVILIVEPLSWQRFQLTDYKGRMWPTGSLIRRSEAFTDPYVYMKRFMYMASLRSFNQTIVLDLSMGKELVYSLLWSWFAVICWGCLQVFCALTWWTCLYTLPSPPPVPSLPPAGVWSWLRSLPDMFFHKNDGGT